MTTPIIRLSLPRLFLCGSLAVAAGAGATTSCRSRSFNPAGAQSSRAAEATAKPKLVVIVVVDQMRSDYLERFAPMLRAEAGGVDIGLLALKTQGTWFSQARTAGAPTVTAAGHASVCSGASPSKHGIIANSIWDPKLARQIETVVDPSTSFVRTPSLAPDPQDPLASVPVEGASPFRLRINAFADVLTELTGGEARAVAISVKDRAAVLCGGKKPRGAYWHDYRTGTMVTSTYYGKALPSWVDAFNMSKRPPFGYVWTPTRDAAAWKATLRTEIDRKGFDSLPVTQGEDAQLIANPLGGTFPYAVKPEGKTAVEAGKRFEYTPAVSDHLVEFALAAIDGEDLGRRRTTDVLVVSFSQPDYVGHGWGPDGLELADSYLKLNATVQRLREGVEAKVGREVVWVLTADHGVQRMPETTRAMGRDAGRFDSKKALEALSLGLSQRFGEGDWVHSYSTDQATLNKELAKRKGVPEARLVEAARGILATRDGVKTTFSRDDLLSSSSPEAFYYRRGYDAERSGDVFVVVKEGWLGDGSVAGNHGTVYEDDARIPMAFSGPGIRTGAEVSDAVRADDIAPTILDLLGLPRGEEMTGRSLAVSLRSR